MVNHDSRLRIFAKMNHLDLQNTMKHLPSSMIPTHPLLSTGKSLKSPKEIKHIFVHTMIGASYNQNQN